MKPAERAEARVLRAEHGWSIKRIAASLGVSVSSVSRWVGDIELTASQLEALAASNPVYARDRIGTRVHADSCRANRRLWQEEGRALARRRDPLHLAGCMLYWAEGSKGRNAVHFTNSDADMLAMFRRFLRDSYGVTDDRIRLSVSCHLNNGLSLAEIERWWLERLDLPPQSLRAPTVDQPSVASRWKRNVLVYGTARLAVYSTRIVQSIYGAIQEYAGIERSEWLG